MVPTPDVPRRGVDGTVGSDFLIWQVCNALVDQATDVNMLLTIASASHVSHMIHLGPGVWPGFSLSIMWQS